MDAPAVRATARTTAAGGTAAAPCRQPSRGAPHLDASQLDALAADDPALVGPFDLAFIDALKPDAVLPLARIPHDDVVAVGDFHHAAEQNIRSERLRTGRRRGLLPRRGHRARLARLAILIVRAIVAAAEIPTDISTMVRGAAMPAVTTQTMCLP